MTLAYNNTPLAVTDVRVLGSAEVRRQLASRFWTDVCDAGSRRDIHRLTFTVLHENIRQTLESLEPSCTVICLLDIDDEFCFSSDLNAYLHYSFMTVIIHSRGCSYSVLTAVWTLL